MLAVGLGATLAVVRAARNALCPEMPFPEPNRLAVLGERRDGAPFILFPSRYAAYRQRATSFASMAAERTEQMSLVLDRQPYLAEASWVTPEFFSLLGVAPHMGRLFTAADHQLGLAGSNVIISHRLWTERFSTDPQVVGRSIFLGGKSRMIIGVLPATFVPPPLLGQDGLYLAMAPLPIHGPDFEWVNAMVRLKPGVGFAQAQAELGAIRPADSSDFFKPVTPFLEPVRETYQNDETRLFWVFLAAAGFLYAIACANAANLMLARTIDRQWELAVRLALGGTPRQIARLILAESVILVTLAGFAGAGLAEWGYWILNALRSDGTPTGSSVFSDAPTIAVLVGLNALAAVIIAIVPTLRIARSSLSETMKTGAGTLGDSRRMRGLRNAFVVMQAALAVVLLAGAGLMLNSFYRLQRVNLGFDTRSRYGIFLRLDWNTPLDKYMRISAEVRDKLASLPGIKHVALSGVVPLASNSTGSVRIADRPGIGGIACALNWVSPDFFAALGLPIQHGHGFDRQKPGDPSVVVINDTMVRRVFADRNPLGCYLDLGSGEGKAEIVGVVGDVHQISQRERVLPQYYVPFWQTDRFATYSMSLLIQTSGKPGPEFEAELRRALYEAAPEVVPTGITPIDQSAFKALRVERYTLILLAFASGLALALAAAGLFAVVAYSVAQQRREFGLRIALGATAGNVSRLVFQRGLSLASIGIAVGLIAAWALTRCLQSVLFETSPTNPRIHCLVVIALLVVTALACWFPARRATRVDPLVALRAE